MERLVTEFSGYDMKKFDYEMFRILVRPIMFVRANELRGQSRVREIDFLIDFRDFSRSPPNF
jgi:hypothetical protein